MAYPEWTEAQNDDQEAIQFLRLNEMRDGLNELLFPYLITITPYFREVSWLSWILTKVHEELQQQKMTNVDYKNTYLRYYGIFSVADILHSTKDTRYHRGPIGVLLLRNNLLTANNVNSIDFSDPLFGKPLDPLPIYRSSLIAMGLFEEKLQPLPRGRYQSILVPTELGKKLSIEFENNWSRLFKVDLIARRIKWDKTDLEKLGKKINLQGLQPDEREALVLQEAVRFSLKDPKYYNDFKEIVLKVVKKADKADSGINSFDVSKTALYKAIPISEKQLECKLKDCEVSSLLAYHELHTHMSFGADAVLESLVCLSQEKLGITKQEIVKRSSETTLDIKFKDIQALYKMIKNSFIPIQSLFQSSCPPPFGKLGFETVRLKISTADTYYEKLALASISLLQSSACQESFNQDWLLRVLPHHRKVFSSYTILEEYQAMKKGADLSNWIEIIIDLIIEKHDEVADSKGLYAKRFEYRDGRFYYRSDADFSEQRGRLANAVLWLSDIGLIENDQGIFGMVT